MSRRNRLPVARIIAANIAVVALFAAAALALTDRGERKLMQALTGRSTTMPIQISHRLPLRIQPLYNDPSVVADEELRDVLRKVRPLFETSKLSPNYVEHALRAWGAAAQFDDPAAMDGPQMVNFLTDHGRYLASWGNETAPLLIERPDGVSIAWGRTPGQSVHHDHWLACLSEAGVPLDMPIYGPQRRGDTLNDALQEALRDFDPAERETEWSVMAFGFWLPPDHKQWRNRGGRLVDFNLLAETLMRGDKRLGVCSGTHRVYSLMVLLRLDDRFGLLTPQTRELVMNHLRKVRDLITLAQWEDGRWAGNWPLGQASARSIEQATAEADSPEAEPTYRQVIATGHHLEWLAIAYPELHPNRDVVRRAAKWIVQTVRDTPQEDLMKQYTFFSHVGNALALWRKTHPADAWPVLERGESLEP